VLVPGIEEETWKWVRCLKVQAYTEVLCWGSRPMEAAEREEAPLPARVNER